MKRYLLLLIFFSLGAGVFAQNIPAKPNPPRLVNDFAHVLTPDQLATLENKLVAYDDSTSTQIAIVTVDKLNGDNIEEYALAILRNWGVGNKKTNNGIVIVAAIGDRKIWIATGYGLEGAVPDLIAKQIIDTDILPNFKEGNYYRGFDEASDALIRAAAGTYKAPENYRKRGNKGGGAPVFMFIIIMIIVIMIISRGGGGGRGGMMSRRGFSPWIFPFPGGGGGGWSGGGGGGGWSGGGGGGFGGFGGGSGGGGGAGGSW